MKPKTRKGPDRGSAALGATLDKAGAPESPNIFDRIISFRSKPEEMPEGNRAEIERAIASYSNALAQKYCLWAGRTLIRGPRKFR
jgi:hypothetical protein